jgi:hypothetical protein
MNWDIRSVSFQRVCDQFLIHAQQDDCPHSMGIIKD